MTATTLGTAAAAMFTGLQGVEGNLAGMESHPDEDFAVDARGEEFVNGDDDEDDDEEVSSPAKRRRVDFKRGVSDPGTGKPHRRGKKVSARRHRWEMCY